MNTPRSQPRLISSCPTAGFTLIETLIAIVVLLVAVLGPLTMLAKAISDGNFARNQTTAFYLAQEGMEMMTNLRDVKTIRDENQQLTWENFVGQLETSGCFDDDGCDFNTNDIDQLTDCPNRSNQNREEIGCLILRDTDGFFAPTSHATAAADEDPTIFSRKIKVVALSVPDVTPWSDAVAIGIPLQFRVDTTVSWRQKTTDRSVTVTSYLAWRDTARSAGRSQ